MNKKDIVTKILAIVGTVLMWLPILAPVLFSVMFFIAENKFQLDYLMPAELFPVGLLGGGLLIWASIRARSRLRIIVWGLGTAVVMLVGSQALAAVTGLASGEIEPVGWQWTLVMAGLIVFSLALVVTGIGGVLLLKDLFKSSRLPAENL